MFIYSELKEKTTSELFSLLHDLKKEQFSLRVQGKMGQIKNTARFREVRRSIARIKTRFREFKAS